jgi:steroid delta-isomerase-like uncharacterized protein
LLCWIRIFQGLLRAVLGLAKRDYSDLLRVSKTGIMSPSLLFTKPHALAGRRTQMPQDNNNLLHRWFEEVWNQGREEAIDELAAPDVIAHGLVDHQGKEVAGVEAFKEFWKQFREVFPDMHIDVADALMDGDKAMVRCTIKATHAGDGLGVAATQKPVMFTGMCAVRCKDGKIAEAWNNFDFLSLYQQIGMRGPV